MIIKLLKKIKKFFLKINYGLEHYLFQNEDSNFGWKLFYDLYLQYFQQFCLILKWIPILWNDKEYDYFYLLYIILFKLKQMKRYYEKENHYKYQYENRNQIQFQIENAILHLKKYLIELELHDNNLCILFDKKFGKIEIKEKQIDNYLYRLDTYFSKCATKEQQQYADKLWNRIYTINYKRHRKHYNQFFEILKNNLERWWD